MKHKARLTSSVAALASVLAIPAAAELKYDNNSGGFVVLYGQLNPAIISVDDGEETETNIRDFDASNSRVGLRLEQPYGDNTFRFRFETALGLPNSTETDQNGNDYSGWTREDIRHVDFSLEGDWGTFSAGQGSMAADGVAEQDLSAVGLVLYSFTADSNASFLFRDDAGILSGPVVVGTTDNFDGARRTRVRYDTPSFNGFSFSAAYGQNVLEEDFDDDRDYYDFAAYYRNTLTSGMEIAAGLAYQVRGDGNSGSGGSESEKREDIVGSASILLENGLSFTFAAGDRDVDDDTSSDPSYYYFKVGYQGDWFSFGRTGIGLHYWDGSDFNVDGSDSDVWGIGVVQNIDSLNMEAYFSYQDYSYDDSSDEFEDLSTVVLGARWRF